MAPSAGAVPVEDVRRGAPRALQRGVSPLSPHSDDRCHGPDECTSVETHMDSLDAEKCLDVTFGKRAPQLRAEALHVPRPDRRHERRREERRDEREQEVRRERPVPELVDGRPGVVGDEERAPDCNPRDEAGAGRERDDFPDEARGIVRAEPFPEHEIVFRERDVTRSFRTANTAPAAPQSPQNPYSRQRVARSRWRRKCIPANATSRAAAVRARAREKGE